MSLLLRNKGKSSSFSILGLIEFKESAIISFRKNMLELIKKINQIGAISILGGLYPSNQYSSWHYNELLKMQKEMETWGVLVFPFLSATDDSHGISS